jgi:hypothetical protein
MWNSPDGCCLDLSVFLGKPLGYLLLGEWSLGIIFCCLPCLILISFGENLAHCHVCGLGVDTALGRTWWSQVGSDSTSQHVDMLIQSCKFSYCCVPSSGEEGKYFIFLLHQVAECYMS